MDKVFYCVHAFAGNFMCRAYFSKLSEATDYIGSLDDGVSYDLFSMKSLDTNCEHSFVQEVIGDIGQSISGDIRRGD